MLFIILGVSGGSVWYTVDSHFLADPFPRPPCPLYPPPLSFSAGIGLELTKQLIARGDKVIAAVRTTNDELAGTGATVIENIDVTSDESAAALAAAVDDASIDGTQRGVVVWKLVFERKGWVFLF